MQKLSEFHQKLEATIHHEIDSWKNGITVKAAAYSSKMSNQHVYLYKILDDLISVRTDGSATSHQKCIEYIKKYAKRVNPQCIIQSIPTNGKDNLVIAFNVSELKNIQTGVMFCGHLDVVCGKSNQFEAMVENKRIYGRGVTDMKGAIACYLEIIPYTNTLELPIIMCFTCDEETDMQGIKDVCAFLDKQNIKPHLTILGEPTNNKLGISSTGIKSYKTIIHGVAAHSSVLNKGVNALFVASRILQSLEKITQKMISSKLYLNAGSINGGGNIAIIPDNAEIEWGFRYTREKDAERVMQLYDKALMIVNEQYPTATIETVKTADFLGYSALNKEYIAKLRRKLNIETIKLPYTAEAGYLAEIGQNVYLLGCGSIEQAHSDNEYINIDNLIAYKKLLLSIVDFIDGIRNKKSIR